MIENIYKLIYIYIKLLIIKLRRLLYIFLYIYMLYILYILYTRKH